MVRRKLHRHEPSLSVIPLMVSCWWFALGCHFSHAMKVVLIAWIFWVCTRIWVFPSSRSFRLTFYNMCLKYSQITGSVCFTWRRPPVRSRSPNLEEDNAVCVYPDISSYNSAQFKTVVIFSARRTTMHRAYQCLSQHSHFAQILAFLRVCNVP